MFHGLSQMFLSLLNVLNFLTLWQSGFILQNILLIAHHVFDKMCQSLLHWFKSSFIVYASWFWFQFPFGHLIFFSCAFKHTRPHHWRFNTLELFIFKTQITTLEY
jgi:hypothetical protein